MILSLVAALAAAVGYGVSTIMQAVATRSTHGLAAVTTPLVVAALLVDGLAWLLSLVALDRLPLFLVQAVLAGSVVVVVLLARWFLGARLRRVDVVAVVAVVLALVVIGAAGGEQPPTAPPAGFVAVLVTGSVLLALATVLLYRSGSSRALSVAAGLGYSVAALGARTAHAADDLLGTVLQPVAVAVVLGGVVGAVAYLRALEQGRVGGTAATASVLEVVVPGGIGVAVLGDVVRDGWAVPAVLALAVALAACVVLATSPANSAAEGQNAARPGDGAPASV